LGELFGFSIVNRYSGKKRKTPCNAANRIADERGVLLVKGLSLISGTVDENKVRDREEGTVKQSCRTLMSILVQILMTVDEN
jgi:hypothetical protein